MSLRPPVRRAATISKQGWKGLFGSLIVLFVPMPGHRLLHGCSFYVRIPAMPMPSSAPFAPAAWTPPLTPADPPSWRAAAGGAQRHGRARAGWVSLPALPRLLREIMLGAVLGILGGWLAGWIAAWLLL
ncbi:hypothetical protein QMO56_03845 [Roseomonas sp. E05]|uniref:hypothetical protein n=1 Tax=Roseomonas sp. E05 TaxID=3046310 RepID=UPI0024B90EF2|nr:hypothetical protein [Roseomonas sp. E05]MDJ0387237.1 hypothetical protein [Roseomonas sp. E05]